MGRDMRGRAWSVISSYPLHKIVLKFSNICSSIFLQGTGFMLPMLPPHQLEYDEDYTVYDYSHLEEQVSVLDLHLYLYLDLDLDLHLHPSLPRPVA